MANAFIKRLLVVACAVFLAATAAHAAINVPSDGSDGAFNPTADVTIDLSQAVTGTWSQDNTANAGKGVYDPIKWAVVFKYSAVNIPAGVTVSFTNNAFRAPVVWLVQGDVTISGIVNLNGQPFGPSGVFSEPGPGGFRGAGTTGSAGLGPGGGLYDGGSYGTKGSGASGPTYGNAMALPLIGGSGGGGGAGGGAILIAAGNGVTVNGSIAARGGDGNGYYGTGGGSGGAIRLLADSLTVGASASLGAQGGGGGGAGRIVLEANQMQISSPAIGPMESKFVPADPPRIWPEPAAPSVKITQVGGVNVPAEPLASFDFPKQDISLATSNAVTVRVEATNVPTSWSVVVRTVPKIGQDTTTNATLVSGDASASVWEAQVTMPKGFAALQARAFNP